jgi:hypothetical protein
MIQLRHGTCKRGVQKEDFVIALLKLEQCKTGEGLLLCCPFDDD